MATMMQMEACRRLQGAGFESVGLPAGENSPIPGLILMMDEGHQKLMLVQGDGTAVDLLKVYRLAEDCVRNWHKGDKLNLPQFVGDFKRLTPLAKALNGKRYALPEKPPPDLSDGLPHLNRNE